MTEAARRITAFILIAGWLLSIVLPVTYGGNSDPIKLVRGWDVLLLGYMGLMVFLFSWYANILFAFICYLLLRRRPVPKGWGIALGIVTILFSLESFAWESLSKVTPSPIFGYFIGFWVWLAVMVASGASIILSARQDARV